MRGRLAPPRRATATSCRRSTSAAATARARRRSTRCVDVSIDFERGRFTAIMGPSGSGQVDPDAHPRRARQADRRARSLVDGDGDHRRSTTRELTKLRRDKLGFVFQFFNLLPVLTAEENLVLPLSIAGRKPDEAWLEQLIQHGRPRGPPHATGPRSSPAASSSGSRSPAPWSPSRPSSSPTSRPATSTRRRREDVLQLLRQAVDEFGQTVIMVTHDPEAAAYADRLITLRDGEIVHDAAPGLGRRGDRADEADWLALAVKSLWARKVRGARRRPWRWSSASPWSPAPTSSPTRSSPPSTRSSATR